MHRLHCCNNFTVNIWRKLISLQSDISKPTDNCFRNECHFADYPWQSSGIREMSVLLCFHSNEIIPPAWEWRMTKGWDQCFVLTSLLWCCRLDDKYDTEACPLISNFLLYFTYLPRSRRRTDFHQILHSSRSRRRNHLWQIFGIG